MGFYSNLIPVKCVLTSALNRTRFGFVNINNFNQSRRLNAGSLSVLKNSYMKRKIYTAVFILSVSILSIGCNSSSNFINKNYSPSSSQITLGIIPIQGDLQSFSDSTLTIVYADSLNRYSTYPLENVHKNIQDSEDFSEIVNKLVLSDFSPEELKQTPNLNSILSSEELDILKDNLGNSNLLLLPINFNINSKSFYTFGIARFRLFDLNTGTLIYDISDNFNVNQGGEIGQKNMTLFLIANSYSYFKKNILENS